MGRFDGGVGFYTMYKINAAFPFPEDVICCRYCRFCRSDNGGIRYKCAVTDRILYAIDGQPDPYCPMEKEDTNGQARDDLRADSGCDG